MNSEKYTGVAGLLTVVSTECHFSFLFLCSVFKKNHNNLNLQYSDYSQNRSQKVLYPLRYRQPMEQ